MTYWNDIRHAPGSELLPEGSMRWRREQGRWVGAVEGIDLIVLTDDHAGLFRWGIVPVDDRLRGGGSAKTLAEAKRVSAIAVIYARAGQQAARV